MIMNLVKHFREGWRSVDVLYDGAEYSVEMHDLYQRCYIWHIPTKRKALSEAKRLLK